MDGNVLVLNNTYEAINICSIQRAFILVFKGVAVLEEATDKFIHSVNKVFPVPAVIRLVNYIFVPMRNISITKRNILIRDKYICQYCGKKFSADRLTIDHIVPKSLGGKTTWDNVVAACVKCNNKKANKTLKQAGMSLINKKTKPKKIVFLHMLRNFADSNVIWRKYVFY